MTSFDDIVQTVADELSLWRFQREDLATYAPQKARLIGYEMSLGKTRMGVGYDMVQRRSVKLNLCAHSTQQQGKTLVLAPLGNAIKQWKTNFATYQPGVPIYVIDPKKRNLFLAEVQKPGPGIYIMHWDALRLMPELQKVQWMHIIGDEIHRAKNRKAQVKRALQKLKTDMKTGLSGTPADDKPQDFWSIINWLWPSYYTSYWRFVKHYCVQEVAPEGYTKIVGVQNEKSLQKEIAPWFSRRMVDDEDVDVCLPPKRYLDLWVELTPSQRRIYDQMKKDMIAWVDEHKDTPMPIISSIVAAQLTRLQQFALADATIIDNPAYIRWAEAGFPPRKKDPSPQIVRLQDPSAKLDEFMRLLGDNENSQFILFSQSKQMVQLAEKRLRNEGYSIGMYTGDEDITEKMDAVEGFMNKKIQIFAGTIAAGGEAIDGLQVCHNMVFFDRDWRQSKNLQAEARARRPGQEHDHVMIYDIMARNTVDIGRRTKIMKKWSSVQKLLGDRVDPREFGEDA